jgi:hypothetical protein
LSLLGPPISQIAARKFLASVRREFRLQPADLTGVFDASVGQIPSKLQKFPADSRISGNLDAETGSTATASATTRIISYFLSKS